MELLYKLCFGLTAISGVIQGLFVLYKNPRSRVNITWVFTSFAVAIFSVTFVTYLFERNYDKALFLARICNYAAAFIPVFFSHFCLALLNRPLIRHPLIIVGYVFVILLGQFFFTSEFIPSVSPKLIFRHFTNPGPLYIAFTIQFFALVFYSYGVLFRYFHQQSPKRKEQIRYVVVATIIGYVCGSTTFLPVYDIPFNPWPSLFTFVYAGITTYAIVKHQLMDIKVAITRTGVFLATYLVVLGVPFVVGWWGREWLQHHVGQEWWLVPVGLCMALATVGPFAYAYLRRQAEARLLKDQRQYQRLLQHAAQGMTRVRDLSKLTQLIVRVVSHAVRVQHASLFLFEKSTKRYRLMSSSDPKRLVSEQPDVEVSSALIQRLFTERQSLHREEVPSSTDAPLDQELQSLDANLVVPGFVEGELIGFLVLGNKLSGESYSLDDLHAFSTLAHEAAIAIENARSYEELLRVNEQLQAAHDRLIRQERLAAAGQFATGMAHEIKNPLSAIKTFAEYLPEKYQDPAFREKFFRIVQAEIDRISGIIKEFSEFAKPTPLNLQPVHLSELVDDILSLLSNQCLRQGVEVKRSYRENGLQITADAQQLKQVFLNLVLNSLEAMPSGGRLEIVSRKLTDTLVIEVTDTGCGVPEELQDKLWDPFFTTKERGMGLGLAIVKSIVERHGGQIELQSQPDHGTTVHLSLPISTSF